MFCSFQGSGTLTGHLDRLCRFFQCELKDLAEYVPDEIAVTKD